MTQILSVDSAYSHCLKLAQSHYENFPVASILLPKYLRKPIAAIYAFARTADDYADEGDLPAAMRIQQLDQLSAQLKQIQTSSYSGNDPIFIALQDTVQHFKLPVQLLEDLLIAFRQDVNQNRYQSFDELLNYCRYSANPVGRLVLYLAGEPSSQQLAQSDAVCTALQLINFYQDIVQDLTEQNRLYLPLQELSEHDLTEQDILKPDTRQLAPVLRSLYQRTANIMVNGVPLGTTIPGRLGWEIRAMTLGGVTTLAKLQNQPDHQLLNRPRLSRITLFGVLMDAVSLKRYDSRIQSLL